MSNFSTFFFLFISTDNEIEIVEDTKIIDILDIVA